MASIAPDYVNNMEWKSYANSLDSEYLQSTEEGLDIERYKDLFDSVKNMPYSKQREDIADSIFSIVADAEIREGYEYNEPSELDEIKALRDGFEIGGKLPSKEEMKKKIEGAWYGRICGCLLGKPVECSRTDELIPFLKDVNNYPMNRYILNSEITDEIQSKYSFDFKGHTYIDNIDGAPIDDDTNYTVLSQVLIERYGKNFTSKDVGEMWLSTQPIYNYFTAERVAFKNLVMGFVPPNSAKYKNPFREWIGAQIRGDYYGYINPGDAEKSADMAFRDAAVSHTKNGIYGEMFVSAMISGAALSNNIIEIIKTGLSQIPKTSRLYKEISDMLCDYENGVSCDEAFEKIHKKYDEYTGHGWCHTLSNARIVVAGLLYGEGNYSKSICLCVQTGFDTDCNAATVGSVLGMAYGIDNIDSCWYSPINNKLNTSILGYAQLKVSDLIEKTMEHIYE